MLKLSIAMDLAKYLDFPSAEVVHFPHQTWFPKTGPFRSLSLVKWTRSILSSHYHQLSKRLSSSNLYDQGRAHIAKWLHCKLSQHLASKSLLCLGGIPQVRFTSQIHGLVKPLNQKPPFKSHSTQEVHCLSCFIKKSTSPKDLELFSS